MRTDDSGLQKLLTRDFTEALIRIGLIAFLVAMCLRVFAPFADLMLWSLILAVALYPIHQRLAKKLGGHQGLASALLVTAAILLVGIPTVMLGGSFASHVHTVYTDFENNEITIKQPGPKVAEWPIVGERIHSAWSSAADNLPAYLKKHQDQFKNLAKKVFAAATNTAGAVLLFLGALIIAGIIMAYGETGRQTIQRIFNRLTGPLTGQRLQVLSTATVRSVANGVIGVAFIQSLLLGMGFFVAGIPAAGVLALVAMFIGIVQLPAVIISLPAIAYIWWAGDASTIGNILYTVYLLIAGMVDNVLKPILLGRGVDAPMPVILIGALGGMVVSGIIGMFVGAVLLAVGYILFMDWVNPVEAGDTAGSSIQNSPQDTSNQ